MNVFATFALGLFAGEKYYKCKKHSVRYPKGAKCPICAKEKNETIKKK